MDHIAESEVEHLARTIEELHGCSATHLKAVEIHEIFQGKIAWAGIVHVFELEGHPSATTGYAWSSAVKDSKNRKFYTVLHVPPVDSPEAAVKAAIVAEYRSVGTGPS